MWPQGVTALSGGGGGGHPHSPPERRLVPTRRTTPVFSPPCNSIQHIYPNFRGTVATLFDDNLLLLFSMIFHYKIMVWSLYKHYQLIHWLAMVVNTHLWISRVQWLNFLTATLAFDISLQMMQMTIVQVPPFIITCPAMCKAKVIISHQTLKWGNL